MYAVCAAIINPAITLHIIVKLPQILKVIAAKSGEGLSVLALYLELVAFISSCAYGYASKFPFRLE